MKLATFRPLQIPIALAGLTAVLSVPAGGQEPERPDVEVVVSPRVLVSADMPDIHHAEPHLAIDPTDPDHLLAAVAVLPDSQPHRIDAFVSFDGGESWERSPLPGIADTETLDPWAAFGPEGLAIVTVLIDDHARATADGRAPAGIGVFRSSDGGRSWKGPALTPYGLGSSYDQQKVGVDLSDGPFRGRIYIAAFHWGPRTRPGGNATAALGVISSHTGHTFRGPLDISANNVHTASVRPVVLGDGTVVLLYREWGLMPDFARTDLLWAVHSVDGGATYSDPFLVSAWTSPGFTDAAAAPDGPWRDRVYAAWLEDVEQVPARTSAAEFRRDAARSLRVAYSDERGTAWSAPVPVTTTEEGVRLLTFRVAVDGEGDVAVVWVESRDSDGGRCHRSLVSVSTDGGDTFSDPTAVAEPACHELPGQAVMYTMGHATSPVLPRFGRGGDYFGLVGLPEGGFRILWSAAEEGVLRLWATLVEVDASPPHEEEEPGNDV